MLLHAGPDQKRHEEHDRDDVENQVELERGAELPAKGKLAIVVVTFFFFLWSGESKYASVTISGANGLLARKQTAVLHQRYTEIRNSWPCANKSRTYLVPLGSRTT